MRSSILLVSALAGLIAQQAPARPPAGQTTPTFRSDVTYVEVDATVTDKQGHFVNDLRREDFLILENGKPQEIAIFSRVEVPLETSAAPALTNAGRAIARDSAANAPFNGRVFVLVLDD